MSFDDNGHPQYAEQPAYPPHGYGQQPAYPPHGYGQQPAYPPPATAAGSASGKQILSASWALLRQDKELLWLPVLSTIGSLIAGLLLFVPGFAIGRAIAHTDNVAGWIGGVLAVFAASVIGIYFQAALVVGAYQRADGYEPTFGGVLTVTWRYRRQILGWAVFTTTVGVAVRGIERRLGIFGRIFGFLAGLAWAVVSFLAVPVVVAEGLGPVDALKRSGHLIRQTWGTGIRTTLRFGVIQLVVIAPVLLAMSALVAMVGGGTTGVFVGGFVFLMSVLVFIALTTVFAAVFTYARAMIYRYAAGLPVPGIPQAAFAGAFVPRRRRR